MKKKVRFLLCLSLAFLLTSCGEFLSVVREKNGEKVVTNYISVKGETIYDETASIKSWKKVLGAEDSDNENLFFKIVNKKQNMVVLGDEKAAVEIKFFEGGYEIKYFASVDEIGKEVGGIGKLLNPLWLLF